LTRTRACYDRTCGRAGYNKNRHTGSATARLGHCGPIALGEDTIQGFEVDEGYLRLQNAGANVILQFDSDGGADSFVNIASLVGPPSITLADIIYQQAGLRT
jgi:hypothetical protein